MAPMYHSELRKRPDTLCCSFFNLPPRGYFNQDEVVNTLNVLLVNRLRLWY